MANPTPKKSSKKQLNPFEQFFQFKKGTPGDDRNRLVIIAGVVLAFFLILQFFVFPELDVKRPSYGEFYQMVERNPVSAEITSAELIENVVRGRLANGSFYQVNILSNDTDLVTLLRKNVRDFNVNPPNFFWRNLVYSLLPVLFLIGFFWFFVYRGSKQGGGGGILSFGKSRARVNEPSNDSATFKDVAGVEEAKEELQEIIEFLKNPKKFQRLGGRIPKGVLLMGPPGTGKTLLARAVAGEAGASFYSISGSDFVEMFVGVGASRVRDLFDQARRSAKKLGKGAIIFIDELDAVGRQRFAGIGGGHDEREQTLNALLVEMDGFEPAVGVILIAATNRPDVLDPALLRPGRFDRQIVVDRPDIKGREEILKVHMRNVKLGADVDLKRLARRTPGFSGADIANLVNEGALLAARRDKEVVAQQELEESIERVVAGPERKSRIISQKEREIVSVHESGHTILSVLLEGAEPLHKVSIIPRGYGALGYTMQMPHEDRYLTTRNELLDKLTVLMGGRVAEEIVFSEITTGAQNDLEVATQYARRMVCEFGMSDKVGNLTLGIKERQIFLGRDFMHEKDYSEKTAILIDEEVRRIIDECHSRAKKLIQDNIEKLKKLSKVLLEKEVMDCEEVKEVLGVAPSKKEEKSKDKPSASESTTPNQI